METRRIFPVIFMTLLGPVATGLAVAADDGGKIFADVCTACHTAKKQPLDKIRLTREEWNEAVKRMVSYGAELPKGKLPELLDYLVSTRGPASTAYEGKK